LSENATIEFEIQSNSNVRHDGAPHRVMRTALTHQSETQHSRKPSAMRMMSIGAVSDDWVGAKRHQPYATTSRL
jgi:hypothetical protein